MIGLGAWPDQERQIVEASGRYGTGLLASVGSGDFWLCNNLPMENNTGWRLKQPLAEV
jgi:hypothetical protein